MQERLRYRGKVTVVCRSGGATDEEDQDSQQTRLHIGISVNLLPRISVR
jgi:hypothetical protein